MSLFADNFSLNVVTNLFLTEHEEDEEVGRGRKVQMDDNCDIDRRTHR